MKKNTNQIQCIIFSKLKSDQQIPESPSDCSENIVKVIVIVKKILIK